MVATSEMMPGQRPDGMDPETGVWQKISLGLFLNIQFHIGIVTQITSNSYNISTLVLKKVFIPKYKLKRKCYVVFDKCLCYQICFHTRYVELDITKS